MRRRLWARQAGRGFRDSVVNRVEQDKHARHYVIGHPTFFAIDRFPNQCDNILMNAAPLDNLASDPEALADGQAVMASFVSGKPLDPEVAKRVRDRGRQIREEIFRQHGLLDIGVPAIRELRGELPDA
jgi:hypothetical protein